MYKLGLFLVCLSALSASVNSQICKRKNHRYSLEDQCDAFYECIDGTPKFKICPDGLLFNEDMQSCSYPSAKVTCDGGIVQRARPTKNCPHREGYFQIGDQCKEYKFCQNGYARVYRCARGMLFNFDIPACDFEQNVHCGNGDYSAEVEDRQNIIPKVAPRPKALPIAPKSPAPAEKESLAPVTAAPKPAIRTQSPLSPATSAPRSYIRTQSPRQTSTTAAPTTTEAPTTTLPTTTIPVTRRIVSNNNLDEDYQDEPLVEY